jgi:hypothetical protein
MTSSVELPESLESFLRARSALVYDASKAEPGRIRLIALGRHCVGEIWIDPATHLDAKDNPHAGTAGYYAVPAVNLVAACEHYDPEYILLWLPDRRVFGTWDSDHWAALVFPGVGWDDIVDDPIAFLNAQWEPGGVSTQLLTPWPDYPFRPGSPF